MLVDSHCHLYDEKLDEIRPSIIKNLEDLDMLVVCSGDDVQTSLKSVELSKNCKNIFATIGTHPHFANDFKKEDLETYKKIAKENRVVAIGEIGLDYYYEYSPREKQKEVLINQIKLANELSLPCVFHVREAIGDFLEIVKANKDYLKNGGVVHSFNGSIESAKILLNLGFYLSFNGISTFKNARNVLDLIKFVPLNRILIETDSPYLTPVPFRSEVNRPEYVSFVAKKVAEIKGKTEEEIIKITHENASRLFGI